MKLEGYVFEPLLTSKLFFEAIWSSLHRYCSSACVIPYPCLGKYLGKRLVQWPFHWNFYEKCLGSTMFMPEQCLSPCHALCLSHCLSLYRGITPCRKSLTLPYSMPLNISNIFLFSVPAPCFAECLGSDLSRAYVRSPNSYFGRYIWSIWTFSWKVILEGLEKMIRRIIICTNFIVSRLRVKNLSR